MDHALNDYLGTGSTPKRKFGLESRGAILLVELKGDRDLGRPAQIWY
jgi:hypothetical protein